MKFTEVLQSIAIVALTAWLCYSAGAAIFPQNRLGFGLLGALLAAVVVNVAMLRRLVSERMVLVVGAALPVIMLVIVGCLVTDHPWLWLVFVLVNYPIYVWIVSRLFADVHETLYNLGNIFHGEAETPREEEIIAGYKGALYLIFCAAIATSEYKFFAYFLLSD